MKKKHIILSIIVVLLFVLVCGTIIYIENYYHADDSAQEYLESKEHVTVEKIKEGYFFDGVGEEEAIIFYPGAKVEATSYAPLLYKLAEQGIDCFLVEMPFRFAILKQDAADTIIDRYDYKNWYMSGHSFGGAVAALYTNENQEKINGIIFLASYTIKDLGDTKILSIYGSEDGVLNMKNYEKNKKYWNDSTTEIIIDGGNHAGFGNYGKQKGDGNSTISSTDQQKQTIQAILNFLK